jgi:3-hydroxy acid dehydrogenase / malonic semialdehyde reductase
MPMPQTILITGATAGFGAAMARRFVRDGHRVIAVGRRAERLDAMQRELGNALLGFTLDVADAEAVAALPGSLPAGWQEVDVLVNNAGLALGLDPAHRTKLEDWDQMLAVNVVGLTHVTHALLPGMMARNRGHVINLGSTAAVYPYPGGHIYGASKSFVAQFTLNLKSDLVGTAVRVTLLEPGLVGGTEFSVTRFGGDTERAGSVYAGTEPLTADDIAEAAAWVIGLPAHMNINRMEIMPTCQAPGPLLIKRS